MALEPTTDDEEGTPAAVTLAYAVGAFGLGILLYFGFAQLDAGGGGRVPVWALLVYYLGGRWLGLAIGVLPGLLFLHQFVKQMRSGESFFDHQVKRNSPSKSKKVRH
jgi:hypothetical protein